MTHEPANDEPQPFMRVPAVTAGLVAVLIISYVAFACAPLLSANAIVADYAFIPARYSPAFLAAHNASPQTFWERAVPFVSYMFLHGGTMHLVLNCVWLLPFGSIVARRYGAAMFLSLFFISGIAGAFAYLASNWGSVEPVVGASAAISGIMAVGFRIAVGVDIDDFDGFVAAVSGIGGTRLPLAPLSSRRLLAWSAIWIALNVVLGVAGFGMGLGPQAVAWQAHIGGYLAGLLLAGPAEILSQRLRPVRTWLEPGPPRHK